MYVHIYTYSYRKEYISKPASQPSLTLTHTPPSIHQNCSQHMPK